MGRLKPHFNRLKAFHTTLAFLFRDQELENAKKLTFFRLGSSKTVMQPSRVSIRSLKFECPDCGSTWQEEIISTPGSIVFKKSSCSKCGNHREVASSIAA